MQDGAKPMKTQGVKSVSWCYEERLKLGSFSLTLAVITRCQSELLRKLVSGTDKSGHSDISRNSFDNLRRWSELKV
jgi:hypothetical protein